MTEHEKLEAAGYYIESHGNGGWTVYYHRDRDGSKAVVEYGPLPHNVKHVKVTGCRPE